MDVDPPKKEEEKTSKMEVDGDDDDDEDISTLLDMVDDASSASSSVETKIDLLQKVLRDKTYVGPKAVALKERAMYDLTRVYCKNRMYDFIVPLLKEEASSFLSLITKAKMAKVVRAVLDTVCSLAPTEYDMQAEICRSIIEWTRKEKRTFLRQRVEAKLTWVLVEQKDFGPALTLVDGLLYELKKLDDKQLLVETHLIEAKIHFGLRNVPKAKAALTASRTAANAIYVSPQLQASIDGMSGTIHCEEGDYNTAHSYFLETFEQLDQLNEREKAVNALKYMMLCRILDSLSKALKISARGGVGAKSNRSDVDISNMISGKQGVKYAGKEIEAMSSIASAASSRSLKAFEAVILKFQHELQDDLLIKHHLHILKEQLLESNLIRIIEPYSCVELSHIAKLMERDDVEKKLSQMILDGKLRGILDQGKGQLIVYGESENDAAMEKGLDVIDNMDTIVTTLFARSQTLRTMMI